MLKKILLAMVWLPFFAFGQTELTLPHLNSVYQASYTNTAAIPREKVSIGLPGIASIKAGLTNTGFSFFNLKAKTDTALVLSPTQAIASSKKNNFFYTGASVELFHVRVRVKNNLFLSAHAVEHVNIRFAYPKDFLNFLWKGNGAFIGKKADFSHLALDAMHYREYAVGFLKYDDTKKLSYAGRLKFLQGLGDVNWKNKELYFKTGSDMYRLDVGSNGVLNTSLPVVNNNDSTYSTTDAKGYLTNFQNKGFAIDLGANYQYNEKLRFTGALNNVGFINWKTNARNYQITGGTYFQGFDPVGDLYKDSTTLKEYGDSLSRHFEYTKTKNSYTTWLTPQLYLSARYQILPKTAASLSVILEKYQSIRPGFSANISQEAGRWLQAVLSYSFQYRSATNIGLALMLKPGPVQFYLAADNVIPWKGYEVNGQSFAVPYKSRYLTFRFGINLVFGQIKTASQQPLPNE